MAVEAQPFCGSQDYWMDSNNVNNACGGGGGGAIALNQFYSSYLNQQQQLQCNSVYDLSPPPPKIPNHHLSFSMAAYEDKQRQEVDHYIRLQNERLRLFMEEQRRQQIALLMKKIESKALPLLRKKDEEIAQAAKRTLELGDFLKRLEMENQAWRRAAEESEAMVVSLNNTIEQMREKAAASSFCFDNGGGGPEDAESCCDAVEDNLIEERKKMKMMCRGCNSRKSCILFLPCRHLCSCEDCEAFLDSCPVCLTGKKATLEALIV